MLAAALNSPISVMGDSRRGWSPWGMALLAGYLVNNADDRTLSDYLDTVVFGGNVGNSISPTAEEVEGFNRYIKSYIACLPVEQSAVDCKK